MFLQIGWRPALGDPSVMGWLTVLVYLVTAVFFYQRARTAPNPRHTRLLRRITAVLFLLAVNKQIDFLSLFTLWGRRLAWQQQWWRDRQIVQLAIAIAVLLTICLIITGILWQLRHWPRRYLSSCISLLLLIGFVLIRATSLHAVDYYLFTPFLFGLRFNWVIELGLLSWLLGTAVFSFYGLAPPNQHPPKTS